MPIYEYTCQACNKKFDQLVRSMSSDAKANCPHCGSPKTARALSVFAAVSGTSAGSSTQPQGGGCGRCGGPNACSMD
jgi:putative FmdB family regulatory protein